MCGAAGAEGWDLKDIVTLSDRPFKTLGVYCPDDEA